MTASEEHIVADGSSKYRFHLINAFSLSENAAFRLRRYQGTREELLYNYEDVAPFLDGIDWDVHPGAPSTHGDWPVEKLEEFETVGVNRLPLVRAACESGRYNAVVLLGGGDPGFWAAREIGGAHRMPVVASAWAQMHVARMLGNRFGIIDISETHSMQMSRLVTQYRFAESCASIRIVDFPLPRPGFPDRPIAAEREAALRGDPSEMLERAVVESVAAIEEDGAEVLILGCSAAYWLQPFLQRRLDELGWTAPVLEGFRCAIETAKVLVDLGVGASGLMIPAARPARWRRRKPA